MKPVAFPSLWLEPDYETVSLPWGLCSDSSIRGNEYCSNEGDWGFIKKTKIRIRPGRGG